MKMMVSTSLCDNIFKPKKTAVLSNGDSLNNAIASSTKKKLLQKIEFVDSTDHYSANLNKYRGKYIVLNPSTSEPKKIVAKAVSKPVTVSNKAARVEKSVPKDGLPNPKYILFSPDKLEHTWKKSSSSRPGCGLVNLGTTCYLNSALQCFTYTPALSNYLLRSNHRNTCKMKGPFCMLCAMQQHLTASSSNSGQAVKPSRILNNLHTIAKHLRISRQEDAHEFIRYSIDAMQKASLYEYQGKKLDEPSKDTTAVHQIFGGLLRSRIKCLRCKMTSDKFDFCLDISIDINKQGCDDIQRCLEYYIKPDMLAGCNAYNCSHCRIPVNASKRFSIHTPPNVLTLQLKRFSCFGNKIQRRVGYPLKLNLRKYMSVPEGEPVAYDLYAVLVHAGYSSNTGHYYMYARIANGQWYCFNDETVHPVQISTVLSQEAYLLFYNINRKVKPPQSPIKKQNGVKKAEHNNVKQPHATLKSEVAKEGGQQNGSNMKRKLKDDNGEVVKKRVLGNTPGGKRFPADKKLNFSKLSLFGNKNGGKPAVNKSEENSNKLDSSPNKGSALGNSDSKPSQGTSQNFKTISPVKTDDPAASTNGHKLKEVSKHPLSNGYKKGSEKISFELKPLNKAKHSGANAFIGPMKPAAAKKVNAVANGTNGKTKPTFTNGLNLNSNNSNELLRLCSDYSDSPSKAEACETNGKDMNNKANGASSSSLTPEKKIEPSKERSYKDENIFDNLNKLNGQTEEASVEKNKRKSEVTPSKLNGDNKRIKLSLLVNKNPEKSSTNDLTNERRKDFDESLKKISGIIKDITPKKDDKTTTSSPSESPKKPISKKNLFAAPNKRELNTNQRQDVLEKLLRQNTKQKFGNGADNVGTWNGSKSGNMTFSKSTSNLDSWDRDFDRGKRKKIKKKKKLSPSAGGKHKNIFQQFQIYKYNS